LHVAVRHGPDGSIFLSSTTAWSKNFLWAGVFSGGSNTGMYRLMPTNPSIF